MKNRANGSVAHLDNLINGNICKYATTKNIEDNKHKWTGKAQMFSGQIKVIFENTSKQI
jgi:hypothetical protein